MNPRRRLIISTDAKNEADDQFAIVHGLLTDTLDVRGIVPAHFRRPGSMAASSAEVELLQSMLPAARRAPVADGSSGPLVDERTPAPSAGLALIIEEAERDEGRLWIAVLGPLTDVASAILEQPRLRERDVAVVWVGGPPYWGLPSYEPEFNLINDVHAANVVMASGLEVWQIPMSVYTMLGVSHAELEERLKGTSPLGDYLVDQLIAFNQTIDYGPLDFRSLGDSPAIGTVMNAAGGRWSIQPAPRFTTEGRLVPGTEGGHVVRACEWFDSRWLIEDMFGKLRALPR